MGSYLNENSVFAMKNLITTEYEKTGKQVVVLIDEYDAPLLDVVHEETTLPMLRNVMRNFFSPLKDSDPYLKFVFLTGITQEEVLTKMQDYIEQLALANEWTIDEAVAQLTQQYDGYHFTWPSSDIFNPFSLLNAMQDKRLDCYWFASGTPTYLVEMMRRFDVLPTDISHTEVPASAFDAPTENMSSITPLLYQSGYITIKDYDKTSRLYTLDIPNGEIRIGLMESLLPNYVERRWEAGMTNIGKMYRALYNNDLDEMLRLLQVYLLTVPYCDNANSEGHYQQMLYIIFSLFGRYVEVEVHTPRGRVDVVMISSNTLYLFELKLNKDAATAIEQINLKDYVSKFALCNLPIVKVGINFDSEQRTITDWEIVRK